MEPHMGWVSGWSGADAWSHIWGGFQGVVYRRVGNRYLPIVPGN